MPPFLLSSIYATLTILCVFEKKMSRRQQWSDFVLKVGGYAPWGMGSDAPIVRPSFSVVA